MTDQELKDLVAESDARSAKIDASLARTAAIVSRTSRQTLRNQCHPKRRAKKFFFKRIKELHFLIAGVQFQSITIGIERDRPSEGISIELDAMLLNSEVVAIMQVATRLNVKDVEVVYDKLIPTFRTMYHEFQDRDLLVIVAGLSVDADALAKAHEYGFICLQSCNAQLVIDASHLKRCKALSATTHQ